MRLTKSIVDGIAAPTDRDQAFYRDGAIQRICCSSDGQRC